MDDADVVLVFKKAARIYNFLKDSDIKINLSINNNGIVSGDIVSDNITNNDKKYLSIFLAIFFVDSKALEIFEDFNLTLENVLRSLDIDDAGVNFDRFELERISNEEIDDNLEETFLNLFNEMKSILDYLSIESLIILLWDQRRIGSNLIVLLLSSLIYNNSPFTDGKCFYDIFYNKTLKQVKNITKVNKNFFLNEKKYDDKVESFFNKYGTFLTDENFEFNPAIGRDSELCKAKVNLLMQDKSLMLVGPGGVGKTAIVEGLAYDIQRGNVPENLKNKQILSVNAANLVEGCKFVGSFEKVINNLLQNIVEHENIILFMDEIHTVFGLGAGSSTLDLANILKPFLGRGKIKMIATTTSTEYDNIIERDSAFKRRFERLDIKEPNKDLLFKIIGEIVKKYELQYGIKSIYDKQVIDELINVTQQSKRVYSDLRCNPDLVLTIVEKSFAYALYNNRDMVLGDDIISAVMDCDVIYQSVREETRDKIKQKLNTKKMERKKIIDYKNYF